MSEVCKYKHCVVKNLNNVRVKLEYLNSKIKALQLNLKLGTDMEILVLVPKGLCPHIR